MVIFSDAQTIAKNEDAQMLHHQVIN